jgi:hypothetical protein
VYKSTLNSRLFVEKLKRGDFFMGKMKKYYFEKEYVQIPNETAKAVETTISLEALGLITNLWSYSDEWELHKTELYKRYLKNKRTSVSNAWKELMDHNYIIEYKYRVGKRYEYDYYYNPKPFTEEQKAEILEYAKQEHGEIWGLDFQQSKMCSPKPTDNKYIINSIQTKEIQTEIDINLPFGMVEEEEKENYKRYSEIEIENFNKKATAYYSFYLSKNQIESSIRKIYKKYLDGYAKDYPKLLDADLLKKEDRAREKKQLEYQKDETVETTPYTGRVPFYNWLEN